MTMACGATSEVAEAVSTLRAAGGGVGVYMTLGPMCLLGQPPNISATVQTMAFPVKPLRLYHSQAWKAYGGALLVGVQAGQRGNICLQTPFDRGPWPCKSKSASRQSRVRRPRHDWPARGSRATAVLVNGSATLLRFHLLFVHVLPFFALFQDEVLGIFKGLEEAFPLDDVAWLAAGNEVIDPPLAA